MPRKQCPLLCSIRKSILPLNNALPKCFTSIWTTSEELHNRLVVAGVASALKPSMVADALRLHNTDECFMALTEHNNKRYYRSKIADLADTTNVGPCKQRFKKLSTGRKYRMNSSPTKYFIESGNRHFEIINNALFQLEEKEKQKQKQSANEQRHAPVQTKSIHVQTEVNVMWEGADIGADDGNCLMSLARMENFIRLATGHSSQCGTQLVLIQRDTSYGAMVSHVWKCPSCATELSMQNCGMCKSSDVAQGAAYSREQPDFNLRLVKGIQLTGINTTKLMEFMRGEMGIKIEKKAD